MVTISLGCDKSNVDKCISAVYKEIARLQEQPLSDRRLKAAKKQLLGQMAISGDNGETQCLSMGKALLAYGKINSGKENRALIESITAEDVCQAAREVFNPSKLSKLLYI
jgi:predicted Zn-dependent peptidase